MKFIVEDRKQFFLKKKNHRKKNQKSKTKKQNKELTSVIVRLGSVALIVHLIVVIVVIVFVNFVHSDHHTACYPIAKHSFCAACHCQRRFASTNNKQTPVFAKRRTHTIIDKQSAVGGTEREP